MPGFDQVLPDLVETWTVWSCDHAGCCGAIGVSRRLVVLEKSPNMVFGVFYAMVYVEKR